MRERATLITPTPEREALCAWIGGRYSGDEYAHRIQVVQWHNNQRGEAVFTHDQKADPAGEKSAGKPRLTPEKIVEISNKAMAASQADCDALGRTTVYCALAFHPTMSADSYSRHTFRLAPKNPLVSGGLGGGGVDADEVHRDRYLSLTLAHSRWQTEQFAEAISGVMALQQEIIRGQSETISRQDAERRQWIIVSEEALSKKQQREIEAAWAQTKITAINEGLSQLKVLLPAVVGMLTKGQAGVSEAIKAFAEGLSAETEEALFGKWNDHGREKPGILDEQQCHLFAGIVQGKIDPSRIGEFVQSVRPEQMMAAQAVLTEKQIQSLMLLAASTGKASPSPESGPQ